jgi:hypothetical protein
MYIATNFDPAGSPSVSFLMNEFFVFELYTNESP